MARVAWATISTGTYNNPNNQLVIDNPLSLIKLEAFPSLFTFNLSFSVIEMNESKHYVMDIEIGEEGGEKIVNADLNIDHQYDSSNPLDVFTSDATISNIRFPHEGLYYVKINVDNSSVDHTIYFIVRKAGEENV